MPIRVKPGELRAYWRRRSEDGHHGPNGERGDLVFHNEVPALRADRALLYYTLTAAKVIDGLSFVEELTKRGYDITTLRFSVHKRAAAGGQP